MQPGRSFRASITVLGLAAAAGAAWAQQSAVSPPQGAAAAPAARPPLLFKEEWREPPVQGERTDANQRFTPYVVANDRIEAKLYGTDSSVVRAARHEGRVDLWTGLATSPVAVTLRDKRNFLDLTGLARLRWIVRTNAIHTLYPVIKLPDATMLVGDRGISTDGEFLSVEIAFTGMHWYKLDPVKVVVLTAPMGEPDLRRVDEVGLATLAPGGGHGIAASANFSTVEMFARPVPR